LSFTAAAGYGCDILPTYPRAGQGTDL